MKDPLYSNKVAAAILTSLLLFFGLPQLANAILGGGGHHGGGHGEELHLAYPIEFETGPAGGAEKKEVVDLGTLLASAKPDVGARKAALCKSCHTFEEGGANLAGPNLWDIVNREVAAVDGFGYSSALKEFGGVWSYDRLDQYLKNSQAYVPGTAMVQRFAKDAARADIVAYLGTLSANPAPFPAPAAGGEEESAEADAHSEEDHGGAH